MNIYQETVKNQDYTYDQAVQFPGLHKIRQSLWNTRERVQIAAPRGKASRDRYIEERQRRHRPSKLDFEFSYERMYETNEQNKF